MTDPSSLAVAGKSPKSPDRLQLYSLDRLLTRPAVATDLKVPSRIPS
jgi:hypothetical protein